MLLITIHHLQECACTCFQMLIHLNHNRYFHQQGILLHIKSISEIQGLPMFVIRTITKKVLVKQITCNFSLVTVVLETSGKFYYTLAGWKFLGFILYFSSSVSYIRLFQILSHYPPSQLFFKYLILCLCGVLQITSNTSFRSLICYLISCFA